MAGDRVPHAERTPLVERLSGYLEQQRIEHVWAGSYRREAETVGDLDLIVVGIPADTALHGDHSPGVDFLRGGPSRAHYAVDGVQVDVWSAEADQVGPMLLFGTGPGRLNVILRAQAMRKGWRLSQYGVFDAQTEERLDDGTEEGILELMGWGGKDMANPRNRGKYA